jgi:S1-C subfamily serine protease
MVHETYFGVDNAPMIIQVAISRVVPGSVAERIGLMPGDQLLEYDREAINGQEQLGAAIAQAGPGLHELVFRHNGRVDRLQIPSGALGVIMVNVRSDARAENSIVRRSPN